MIQQIIGLSQILFLRILDLRRNYKKKSIVITILHMLLNHHYAELKTTRHTRKLIRNHICIDSFHL